MSDKLKFEYDSDKDIITIEGVAYSGDFFRMLGSVPTTRLFRIRCDEGINLQLWRHIEVRPGDYPFK